MVKAFFLIVAIGCCSSLAAQTSVPSVVFQGKCDTGVSEYRDWFQQTRLPKVSRTLLRRVVNSNL